MELRELNVVDVDISLQRNSLNGLEWKTMWEVGKENSVGGDVEVSWVNTDLEIKSLVVVKWVGMTDLASPSIVKLGVHSDDLVLLPSETDVKSNVSSREQVDGEVLVLVLDQSIHTDLKSRTDSVWESE